jgi:transaldolase
MNPIEQLRQLGQSVWLDDLSRRLIVSGELAGMVARGEVTGVTSNPTIFQRAIAESSDYDADLARLRGRGLSTREVYEALVVEDVRAAADLLRPVYERTGGADGYVSLEVDPALAYDTVGTVAEARRLWTLVDRSNLMVKIPGTRPGIPAVAEAVAAGMNVNVTLLFSVDRYLEAADAYLRGLERRLDEGKPVDGIMSVASFFVSRVDTRVDGRLRALMAGGGEAGKRANGLLGKTAVANARLAYCRYLDLADSPRFRWLQARGAWPQRLLWASTSTKDPAYSDVKYIEELALPQTITTVPGPTLRAFLDHGRVDPTRPWSDGNPEQVLRLLGELGIDLPAIMAALEAEGVEAFARSFAELMAAIGRHQALVVGRG